MFCFFPTWNWTAIGICFSQLDLLCQPLCVLRPLSGHLTSFSALTGASGQLVTPARQVTSIQQCSRCRQVPALPRIVLPRRVCPEYIRVVRSSPFLQARSHFPHGHRGDFLVRSLSPFLVFMWFLSRAATCPRQLCWNPPLSCWKVVPACIRYHLSYGWKLSWLPGRRCSLVQVMSCRLLPAA